MGNTIRLTQSVTKVQLAVSLAVKKMISDYLETDDVVPQMWEFKKKKSDTIIQCRAEFLVYMPTLPIFRKVKISVRADCTYVPEVIVKVWIFVDNPELRTCFRRSNCEMIRGAFEYEYGDNIVERPDEELTEFPEDRFLSFGKKIQPSI